MVEAAWFSTNHSFKKIYILYPIFETCWCREEKPFIPPTPHLPHLAKYSTNPSIGSLTEKGGEGGTGLFTSFGFNPKNANFSMCGFQKKCDVFCNSCNFYNFLYWSTDVAKYSFLTYFLCLKNCGCRILLTNIKPVFNQSLTKKRIHLMISGRHNEMVTG